MLIKTDLHKDQNRKLFVDSSTQVAFSYQDFFEHVSNYRSKIAKFKQETGKTTLNVLLFHSHPFHFAVRLLALAQENITIVLPQNQQRQSLADLGSYIDATAGEIECSGIRDIDNVTVENSVEYPFKWPDRGELWFFTSGSSGRAKRIKKHWHQVNTELKALQSVFSLPADVVFMSSVSHQHIYGLLFRLLWPLSLKRELTQTIDYPEVAVSIFENHSYVCFISSPAFLSRLVKDNIFLTFKDKLVTVFSSGGMLADTVASALYQELGLPVTQVYGSTETGGVAYRQVTQLPASAWTLFPKIRIDIEPASNQIVVKSPLILEEQLILEDKGRLHDGKLILLGRADRTIKLEEKRINLTHMEQSCSEHPWVEEIKIISLGDTRVVLAAVVVLSAQGFDRLNSEGRKVMGQILRRHLLEKFELVTLPKKWRYVQQLPYNSQGKLPMSQLENLFERITEN